MNKWKRLVPIVVFVLLMPVLIGLGFWQLDRAEQKRELQAMYDSRMSDAPVAIGARIQDPEALQYYPVTTRGHYDAAYSIYLDNRVHNGKAGYFVITPLRIENSETRVLVNRGWVPLGPDRATLPNIVSPTEMQQVTGVAAVPHAKAFRLAPPPPIGEKWQAVWQHMDMERYKKAVPFPVQPVVILLDQESKAGGFIRQWKRLDTGIVIHQGYAFQWFSLAVALAAIFVFLMFGRNEGAEQTNNDIMG